MYTNFDNCKLLNDDVLLKMIPKRDVASQLIYTKESVDDSAIQFFTVLEVAKDTKFVKKGDTVVISWKRVTNPFKGIHGGVVLTMGITSEKEIDCIVEV